MSAIEVSTMQRDTDGKFPQWAGPGGYTILYLTARNEPLCADCASKDRTDDYPGPAVYAGTYDEGPAIECEDCGKEIESSYGDPDAE